MTVAEVIELAANSELSNLPVRDDNAAIVGFINLGLIELYKRFPLHIKEQIIDLVDDTEIYNLASDCMWLTAAYGEMPEGMEGVNILPINEEDNPRSVNTVSWSQVQIPANLDGDSISLIYVASPTLVNAGNLDVELPLPPQMVEPLLHYVGYRAQAALDGNIQAENTTHYTRFEQSCQRIKDEGMFTSDDMSMDSRIVTGGFK